ncbi:Carboxypeptidase T precursor [compost metagenome]
MILYPYGHIYGDIPIARDRQVHEVMAKKMATWNGYEPQKSSELYLASGDTTDWSYGELKIISFTFELDPGNSGWGSGGFYPGAGIIPEVQKKNLEPVLYMIEYADNPYRSIDEAGGGPIFKP